MNSKDFDELTGALDGIAAYAPARACEAWLVRGVSQKKRLLPLFLPSGARVPDTVAEFALKNGYVEPYFANPTKPDWVVYKMTDKGWSTALAAAEATGRA